ncbi:MAG: hypothetical protein K8823_802 [Cenarchaeum symbiont of Oopsacas minuta]|nr:hypothetical protein [Cenarchaeum symbiont of Oopsacas minuta]
MAEDYVAMCTACKKAVDRKDLYYVNGLSYHTECSKNAFESTTHMSADATRLKIDIVTLKNLRSQLSIKKRPSVKRKTVVKKTRKRVSKKKSPRRISKHTRQKNAPKRRTVKRKR